MKDQLTGLGSLGARLGHALAAQGHDGTETKALHDALTALGVKGPQELDAAIDYWSQWQSASRNVLPAVMKSLTEPIGCLHLERISFIPAGVEHGALVSSLPLAPGESVALVHKEWANTDEEFTKLVADQFEDYSERGVVDKVEMAEACAAQHQHASAFAVSVSAGGGYGPVSATASSGYSVQDVDAASRLSSARKSQDVTQKASSRTRREHRMTFRLAKKTQVDDETVRLIKNPDPFHVVRIHADQRAGHQDRRDGAGGRSVRRGDVRAGEPMGQGGAPPGRRDRRAQGGGEAPLAQGVSDAAPKEQLNFP